MQELYQVDPATNRLVALSGSFSLAMGYDANGNISQRGVLATPDYRKAMLESPYVADIAFELNLDREG